MGAGGLPHSNRRSKKSIEGHTLHGCSSGQIVYIIGTPGIVLCGGGGRGGGRKFFPESSRFWRASSRSPRSGFRRGLDGGGGEAYRYAVQRASFQHSHN